MQEKKIYFFIGTTAELIKIAPIIRELEKRKKSFTIIDSGQNKTRFEDLNGFIKKSKPDIVFSEKENKSSVYYFLIWALRTFFVSIFSLRKEFNGLNKNNSYLIIHGDTVSSIIGGFIAHIYNLKLVHIESGDLSFNLFEPFPEEICRNINIRLADILFCPTDWAKNNLRSIQGTKISTKQNTIIETFWWAMKQKRNIKNIKKFNKYYILIMHRQEHVLLRKEWSKRIMNFVIKNADKKLTCVLFNHPLTMRIVQSLELDSKAQKVEIVGHFAYPEFLKLMQHAGFIASDSATLQQEAYYMGKPLLALRNYTEQIEGVGENFVLSKGDQNIIKKFLANYKNYKTKPIIPKQKPSEIIVNYLLKH